MASVLVIVESPTKAKTIGKFLGRKYVVKASKGHVRDLPKSKFGVDIGNDYEAHYITIRGKGKLLQELRKLAQKCDRVILATDPDREGEAISWHLAQALHLDTSQPLRVVFHEITKDAVKAAFKQPRCIDQHLVHAQQARRILDRIVGYKLSPLLWHKVRKGLSAGRVQSVAVKLIVLREREREAFEPEEYWSITSLLENQTNDRFKVKFYGRGEEKLKVTSQEQAREIVEAVKDADFTVRKIVRQERKRNPAPPFTTSSMQQEAARKLQFSAKKTMALAQQLYEGIDIGGQGSVGLITYMRTDSVKVSEQARAEARSYIVSTFGKEYYGGRKYQSKKRAQGAHEAIRPTSVMRTPDSLKPYLKRDQYLLYELIWNRFVASQMRHAILDTVRVEIAASEYSFRATGSTLKFPGFMKLYIEGQDEAEEEDSGLLPELHQGDKLRLLEITPKQHFTEPPPRYTEAMLVRTLEELGIGRPSTYAPTIDTIQRRGYVVKENRRFKPTDIAYIVTDLLDQYFADIVDVEFTAHLEDKLDQVEEGKLDWVSVVDEFYQPFAKDLEVAEQEIEKVEIKDEETDVICEECGRRMVIKHGRYGKFLACPGFPECRNTKPIVKEVGVKCPLCGEGAVVERRSRKGRLFYGCSNYPECKFVSWNKPTEHKCPECGSYLVEKKKMYVCSSKGCRYKRKVDDK